MEDRCVMCGRYVPEGTMVCVCCRHKVGLLPKEDGSTRYLMRMTEDQIRVLCNACEFYSRMLLGQWQELSNATINLSRKDYCECREKVDSLLLDARDIAFPGLTHTFGHSYGVGHAKESDMAWELYTVARHCKAWARNPEGGDTVDFDNPMSFSGEELADCFVYKEEKKK